jgi:hypothetical protein
MVLCQFLGVLAGDAVLHILGVDAELGQVAIVVFVVFAVFVIDNKVAIAIVIVFAAAVALAIQ